MWEYHPKKNLFRTSNFIVFYLPSRIPKEIKQPEEFFAGKFTDYGETNYR